MEKVVLWLKVPRSVATNTAGRYPDISSQISSGFTLTNGETSAHIIEVSQRHRSQDIRQWIQDLFSRLSKQRSNTSNKTTLSNHCCLTTLMLTFAKF